MLYAASDPKHVPTKGHAENKSAVDKEIKVGLNGSSLEYIHFSIAATHCEITAVSQLERVCTLSESVYLVTVSIIFAPTGNSVPYICLT